MSVFLKILISFSFILIFFFVAFLVNRRLSNEVNDNNKWITISEQVVKNSNRLHRNIIDMESGLRGYLLLNDSSLLVPFYNAKNETPKLYTELRGLISRRYQRNVIDTIEILQRNWENSALKIIQAKKNALQSDSAERIFLKLYRNEIKTKTVINISNEIRQNFKEFNSYEYNLRTVQRQKLNTSVEKTNRLSTIFISIALLAGLSLAYLLGKHISDRVKNMVNLSEKISKGDFNISIKDSTKDELGDLGMSLNIMAQKLKSSFAELQYKNNELDQFAYVVSHDLKAPLRGLENISSWIKDDLESNQHQKIAGYLDLMTGRVRRMENLINGILDLARVGRSREKETEVNVNYLLKDVIDLLSPDPRFKFLISPMPTFYTEKTYLQQVFSNLISNAIKYHDKPEGIIKVEVNEKKNSYEFSVQDNGPGIDKAFHEKIFVVFQTLKERDAFESTGVGLAIVKKIIDQVNGKISVESDVDSGAKFIFSWPKKLSYLN